MQRAASLLLNFLGNLGICSGIPTQGLRERSHGTRRILGWVWAGNPRGSHRRYRWICGRERPSLELRQPHPPAGAQHSDRSTCGRGFLRVVTVGESAGKDPDGTPYRCERPDVKVGSGSGRESI